MSVIQAVGEALQFFSETNEGFFFCCLGESEIHTEWIQNYLTYKNVKSPDHHYDSQYLIDCVNAIAGDEHVQETLKLEIITLKSGHEWIVKNTSNSS